MPTLFKGFGGCGAFQSSGKILLCLLPWDPHVLPLAAALGPCRCVPGHRSPRQQVGQPEQLGTLSAGQRLSPPNPDPACRGSQKWVAFFLWPCLQVWLVELRETAGLLDPLLTPPRKEPGDARWPAGWRSWEWLEWGLCAGGGTGKGNKRKETTPHELFDQRD